MSLRRLAVEDSLSMLDSGHSFSSDQKRDISDLKAYQDDFPVDVHPEEFDGELILAESEISIRLSCYDITPPSSASSASKQALGWFDNICNTRVTFRFFAWKFCGGGDFFKTPCPDPLKDDTLFSQLFHNGIMLKLNKRKLFAGLVDRLHRLREHWRLSPWMLAEQPAMDFCYQTRGSPFQGGPIAVPPCCNRRHASASLACRFM